MEKSKVDINILGQDVSVMCTDDEKRILLKVKEKTKNVGHDYFLVLVLLNIAGSDIKNQIKLDELTSVEKSLDIINEKLEEALR